MKAAGITIIPPKATSKKPLPDAAETEDRVQYHRWALYTRHRS